MGVQGLGIEVLYAEGSEYWLYGQRILDDVMRWPKQQKILRDDKLTQQAIMKKQIEAMQQMEQETEEQKVAREIVERAEQAYIRDQEFFERPIVHSNIIEAEVKARKRWAKFQEIGETFAKQGVITRESAPCFFFPMARYAFED
jgi:hypothetical protein